MEDKAVIGKAVAEKSNELERLMSLQVTTEEFLTMLEVRLSVVSHPNPEAGSSPARESVPHISTTVATQREINTRLGNLIESLAV